MGLLLTTTLPALAQIQVPDPQQGQQTLQNSTDSTSSSGPVRLRQGTQGQQQQRSSTTLRCPQEAFPQPEYRPGEFEEYVQRIAAQLPSNPPLRQPDAQQNPPMAQNQQDGAAFDLPQRRAALPKVRRLGADLMTADPCP
ncbi:MAG TPA: hypothetical protein VJO99_18605, partial [Burkholderiaceae bacterium]|nr:hypothetical protein [Burkholderiaceae bacterium]